MRFGRLAAGLLLAAAVALPAVTAVRDEAHWRWASLQDKAFDYDSYLKARPGGRHIVEAAERYEARGWEDAKAAASIQGYGRYLQVHPRGAHAAAAQEQLESLHWQAAVASDNLPGYERYLSEYATGRHAVQAGERLESLRWEAATQTNSIRSYREYVAAHIKGRFRREAESRAAALRADRTPYDSAYRAGTEVSLKTFLADFPGHRMEAAAKQALREITEGRDVVDLLGERKIEVKTRGSGIKSVEVSLRRRVPHRLTVRIPVGTFFVSANPSSQNMVTTEEGKVDLGDDGWSEVSVDAACANRPRAIPGEGDSFTVQRSPNQDELARLMPVLDKAGVSYGVRQAAVWIVTDNADYDDLGILVSRSQFQLMGGTRVIGEEEAARAMRICEEAGIDVRQKAIWRDREKIAAGLGDGEMKRWLNKL